MDHLQNVLSYFDQQQPLCAEHDRIPKDLYREFGVKAGLRDETGKGVLAGLTNISDIRAFQYVDGVKHPADGQLLYRGYDVKDLINGSRGSRFAFEEAGYLLLFGQLPTPEQLEQFCAVLGECRTMPTNFTRDVIMKAPSHDIMNSMARSVLTLASYDPKAADLDTANVLRQSIQLAGIFPMLAVYSYHAYNHYEKDASMYIHRPDPSLSTAENFCGCCARICSTLRWKPACWTWRCCCTPSTAAATTPPLPPAWSPPPAPTPTRPWRRRCAPSRARATAVQT